MQPDVLPCVYAQQRHYIDAAQRLLGLLVLLRGHAEGAHLVHVLVRVGVVCVEVVGLAPVVGARQRRSGQVGGQDAQSAAQAVVVGLHEPDKAGAEHGLGGGEEGVAQGVERGEVLVDVGVEVFGRLGVHVGVGVEAAEEEVVVEGHAGDVEGVGLGRVAGEVDDEGLGLLVLPRRTCRATLACGSALDAAGRWRTGGGCIQLVDDVALVLGVGGAEARGREHARDAVLLELGVVVQRGHCVEAAGGGRRPSPRHPRRPGCRLHGSRPAGQTACNHHVCCRCGRRANWSRQPVARCSSFSGLCIVALAPAQSRRAELQAPASLVSPTRLLVHAEPHKHRSHLPPDAASQTLRPPYSASCPLGASAASILRTQATWVDTIEPDCSLLAVRNVTRGSSSLARAGRYTQGRACLCLFRCSYSASVSLSHFFVSFRVT